MNFTPTPLPGAYTITLTPLQDERGLFARTFCKQEFEAIGHQAEFVQFNHSINLKKGTLRGMHFQKPPHTETKLIRCVAGAVFDVIVDLRAESPTFLKWFGAELSAENMMMMYVPDRFAHGFLTLTDCAELLYHHTGFYTPAAEGGIRFDDPALHIQWPEKPLIISLKDQHYPLLDNVFTGLTLTS